MSWESLFLFGARLTSGSHGYKPIYFQRSHLIQALYDALPVEDKSKIKTSTKVTNIEVTETGVRVTLADGKVEEGSIIIGCDGIYSQTRQTALDLANAAGKGKKLDGLPYKSVIRSYVFRRDWPTPDKDRCLMWETRSGGLAAQGFAQKESLIVALFEHLDVPKEGYSRFSEEEKEAFKKRFVDIHLNESLTVGDVMENDKINWDFFADQEEGKSDIVQYGGRIVLAGDSVHKITPISGLGLNMGVQQSIALVNRLNGVLSTNQSPSSATLEEAFKLFEKDCAKTLAKTLELNTILGDGVTWANWPAWFIDRVAAPWIGLKFIVTKFYSKDILRHGFVLNSLPKDGLKQGQVAWVS